MLETDSSQDASVTAQTGPSEPVLSAAEQAVVRQETDATMAAPAVSAPVPVDSSAADTVTIKEVFQMVGAMVFVFGFAALGFNAMYYAGY